MPKTVIFLDGEFIPAGHNLIQRMSPGNLQGRGIFETMRSYRGKIFAFNKHLTRFFSGAKFLGVSSPLSKTDIEIFVYLTLRKNKLRNARIRLMLWKSTRGKTRIAIVAQAYGGFAAGDYKKGFRVAVSSLRQNRPRGSTGVKSLRYNLYKKAFHRAKTQGCQEAILLTPQGFVSECSRSNIFLVKNKKLFTPHLKFGCLNGITRQIILGLAKKTHVPCRQGSVALNELFASDEIFLTNSLIELMPVSLLQGRVIGSKKNPVTLKLRRAYRGALKRAVL